MACVEDDSGGQLLAGSDQRRKYDLETGEHGANGAVAGGPVECSPAVTDRFGADRHFVMLKGLPCYVVRVSFQPALTGDIGAGFVMEPGSVVVALEWT